MDELLSAAPSASNCEPKGISLWGDEGESSVKEGEGTDLVDLNGLKD